MGDLGPRLDLGDSEPLTVSFEIEPGQVWIDPDAVAWRVALLNGSTVHLERTVVEYVDARDLARKYRRPGEAD